MSSSDSECEKKNNKNANLNSNEICAYVVEFLKTHEVLLEKSQKRNITMQKRQMLDELRQKYEEKFGLIVTLEQVAKKVTNLKTRLREKIDLNKRKKDKIPYRSWEKELMQLIKCEKRLTSGSIKKHSTLPVIKNEPMDDALIEDVAVESLPIENPSENPLIENHSSQTQYVIFPNVYPCNINSTGLKQPPSIEPQMVLEKYETEETKHLSDSQLQRLVLLKQNFVLDKKFKQFGFEGF